MKGFSKRLVILGRIGQVYDVNSCRTLFITIFCRNLSFFIFLQKST
jgi:hypothetical protein